MVYTPIRADVRTQYEMQDTFWRITGHNPHFTVHRRWSPVDQISMAMSFQQIQATTRSGAKTMASRTSGIEYFLLNGIGAPYEICYNMYMNVLWRTCIQ